MKPLTLYLDYRIYLADYYAEMKRSTTFFSYRWFAQKAGYSSPVFLKQVIEAERNLSREMTAQFAKAIGLKGHDATYFRHLVKFNQAQNDDERQEHYSVLLALSGSVEEEQLTLDQYEYFAKWFHCPVRELVTLKNWQNNWGDLGATIIPPISASAVQQSVALLVRLDLIRQKADGSFEQAATSISGGSEHFNLARRHYNTEMIRKAAEANEQLSPTIRNVSGITMGISQSCYDAIVAETSLFRERVKRLAVQCEHTDRVYQLNVQLFPLSTPVSDIPKESADE